MKLKAIAKKKIQPFFTASIEQDCFKKSFVYKCEKLRTFFCFYDIDVSERIWQDKKGRTFCSGTERHRNFRNK